MPGIFGTNIKNSKQIMQSDNRIFKRLESNNFYLELSAIKKFENDKGLFENETYILLLDGVILNLTNLMKSYKKNNLLDLVIKMYKYKEEFFSEFRGCFCGFFYDKINDKKIIFTNHFGDKTIFYYLNKNNIIFSSNIKNIVKLLNNKKINYNIDKASIYSMLTYGYMYNDITPIKEIRRLLPGSYILINNKSITIKKYYQFCNKENNFSDEKTVIDEINKKFENAVKLQLEKNKEYGYDNYSPLSAGLDSRMTNYVLRKLTNKNIYNITYSETGQLDFNIPAQISKELKNHWLFKNLDNGLALMDIDESFNYTDGIIYYAWPSQLNDYMKLINTNKMGIVHTGVIGDVVIGTFFKNGVIEKYKLGDGAFSNKLIEKLKKYIDEVDYENKEIGMFYNRACNGAILGYSMTFQYYTECMSPFMDVDFVDYCLSLPLNKRFQHNIYYKWVNKYYPKAAKYFYNGIKIPSNESFKFHYKNKLYSLDTLPSKILAVMRSKFQPNHNMNPFQLWYDNNKLLKENFDKYYNENINYVEDLEMKNDIIDLYVKGTAIEKIQVISALSIIVNYCKESNHEI